MSDFHCTNCVQTFKSKLIYDTHINSCLSTNDIKENETLSLDRTKIEEISAINNHTDCSKRNSLVNNSNDDKKHKLLKEIEDCGLDISDVATRTRGTKSSLIGNNEKKSVGKKFIKPIENESKVTVNKKEFEKTKTMAENIVECDTNNKENSSIDDSIRSGSLINKLNITLKSVNEDEQGSTQIPPEESGIDRTDEIDKQTHSRKKSLFQCDRCSEEFETIQQLTTHKLLHDFDSIDNGCGGGNETSITGSDTYSDTVSTSGTFSQKSIPTTQRKSLKRNLALMERNSEEEENTCKKPRIKARRDGTGDTKDRDLKSVPAAKKIVEFKCEYCTKPAASLCALQIHKTAYCEMAKSKFKEWRLKNHVGEFGCSVCGCEFTTNGDLVMHKLNDHTDTECPQITSS